MHGEPFSVTHPDGMTVRGTYYPAQNCTGPRPAVIMSHGFNALSAHMADRAEAFAAAGIHCFFYDFRGGSLSTTSDGVLAEMMTLDTERADLRLVMDHVRSCPGVDPDRLFLLGDSQGGMVSLLTAGADPDCCRGLILWFPALVIPEDSRRRLAEGRCSVFGIPICPDYDPVAAATDPWADMPGYTKPVLIIHGDQDPIIPLSAAEKAAGLYPDAKLMVIPGGKHGFVGEDHARAIRASVAHVLTCSGLTAEG